MRRIITTIGVLLVITLCWTNVAAEDDSDDLIAFCAATNALVGAYTNDDIWFVFARKFNDMTRYKGRAEYYVRLLDVQYTEGRLTWEEIIEGTKACNEVMLEVKAESQPR